MEDPLLQFSHELTMLAVKFQWAVERHIKHCQCKCSAPVVTINIDPETKELPTKRKQLSRPIKRLGSGYQRTLNP